MSIFDEIAKGMTPSLTPNNQASNGHSREVIPQPSTVVDDEEVIINNDYKGILHSSIREPKNGSLLMKMKKGDMVGKSASSNYEAILGDIILAIQSPAIDPTFYFLGRLGLGHTNALKVGEEAKKTLASGVTQDQLLNFFFDGNITKMDDFGKYLRTIAPYHKEIIRNHASLFQRLGMT